ncbi:Transposase IS4 [Popillia japonica]|uniref:Transposase IS4 n=1 Tax=Popillia japonica TaxID=7064 RepID=A0AAW1KEZ2_POPJA
MTRKYLTDKELEEILMNDSDLEEGQEHPEIWQTRIVIYEDETQDHLGELSAGDEADQGASSYFYGKNRFKWAKNPPRRDGRTPAHNIVTHLPGLKGPARLANPQSPLQAWKLLFTDEILEIILDHTNAKITELSVKYQSEKVTYINHLTLNELNAFLGLNILAGVFKSGREDAESLWASDGTGKDLIKEHLQERLLSNVSNEIKSMVRKVLGIAQTNQPDVSAFRPPPEKRMRCSLCPRSKDRKHPTKCSECGKPVCKQHAEQRFVCNACTTALQTTSDEA